MTYDDVIAAVDPLIERLTESVYADGKPIDFVCRAGELGNVLLAAQDNLSSRDYERVIERIRRVHTVAEIKASIMIAQGELDPRLFVGGMLLAMHPGRLHAVSKIILLSEFDRARLLSDEKFSVRITETEYIDSPWVAMSPDFRDRLLGPKGGRGILPWQEQRYPGMKKNTPRRLQAVEEA